jgi:hypothetical protein
MNYYGYYHTYKRWILAAILIIIGIYIIIMALDLGNENHSISTTNIVSNNNHMTNAQYVAAKTFFKFNCNNKSLYQFQSSVNSERHVCDQLYLNNGTPTLFSRLHVEFQPFQKWKIVFNDIEEMSLMCSNCHHIQIIKNELYIVPRPKAVNYETRTRSIVMLIKQVVDTFPDIPDLDLFYDVQDILHLPNNKAFFKVPIFGLTKSKKINSGLHADGIILMPCFTLWSWPEARAGRWRKKVQSIIETSRQLEYEKRIPKLFWRGVFNDKRKWIIDAAKRYPDIMDIAPMNWYGPKNFLALEHSVTYKTLEEHCNYKYLLHQEGVSYSSRIKYLLLCGSPVIYPIIDDWEEYWYHLLQNDTNIIFIKANGTEKMLENTINYLKQHEDKAKNIGQRGQQLVLHYLSEQAITCYWWKLIHEYAKLFEYTPILHPNAIHIDDFLLGSSVTTITVIPPIVYWLSYLLLFSGLLLLSLTIYIFRS